VRWSSIELRLSQHLTKNRTVFEKISVIILTYNQPVNLRILLEALAGQVEPPRFEVVVTDDGSCGDNARLSVHTAVHYGLDVRYVWQPDDGFRAARARNNGIRQAEGDLFVFLDGDIIIPPSFLRSHMACHDGSKRVVCGRRRHVFPGSYDFGRYGSLLLRSLMERSHAADPEQTFWSEGPHPWMALYSFAFSVPRDDAVTFDESMEGWGSEDRELALRLFHQHHYQFLLPREIPPVLHLLEPDFASHHDKIVSGLKNKLYLVSKHGKEVVGPALEVMRFWMLDRSTNRWSPITVPRPESLDDILAEASSWLERGS
jgi:glycosyltransferase involved in cell wall biosynthesis